MSLAKANTDVLSTHVEVHTHFSRSVSLERDHGRPISDYLPTARAREVLRRVIAGINDPASGRALSITGTYGTGKSSLGLFLDALLGPASLAQDSADEALNAVDLALHEAAVQARSSLPGGSILVAPVTANREPVTMTLLRGLRIAVRRLPEIAQQTKACQAILAGDIRESPDLLALLDGLAREHAVLLILDEFGKNLEEFVTTRTRDTDLFVLQAIAEWAADRRHHPVLLLTLQHLAFNEYDSDGTRGREWSKIQGRFVDIPYVESPAETQTLIASVHNTTLDVADWSAACTDELDRIGVGDLVHVDPADCYPLHPTLVAALPSLCSRYGQNERTLFSFLAGPDAYAVPSFLANTPLTDSPLPSVRLHHAYDFFLASASTMVGASPHASRWIEIETRLRDTAGLSDAELRVLKTIGVLNLIAAGGSLRASRPLVRIAAVDGQPRTASSKAVDEVLDALTERGLLTYRDVTDEYRIWAGTDYDLKGGVELARRRVMGESVAAVLNRVRPQTPAVAARHSQEFGVLRVFARHFVDPTGSVPTLSGQDYDGLVLLSVGPRDSTEKFDVSAYPAILEATASRPVVVGVAGADEVKAIIEAAQNLAAYQDALKHAESADVDWVARRELAERAAAAAACLDIVIENAYGVGAASVCWYAITNDSHDGAKPTSHLINTVAERRTGPRTLVSVLSDVCDERYRRSPRVRNEMLSRRALTSQGAKARRDLLEAMIEQPGEALLAIEGFGPERAMYDAVLAKTGLHHYEKETGNWVFGAPPKGGVRLGYGPAWRAIADALKDSAGNGITVAQVYARLMAPPIGLKEGPIPVLLVAALIESAARVAIYEDGTFLTRLDVPAVERLIRNPDLFTLRRYMVSGQRARVTERLSLTLGTKTFVRGQRVSELVGVVGVLLGRARALPPYGRKTRALSPVARQVRTALTTATDPEQLLFNDLPAAFGMGAFVERGSWRDADVTTFVDCVMAALDELRELYPAMREDLIERIGSQLAASGSLAEIRVALRTRFTPLKEMLLETGLQTFLNGLVDDALDDQGWVEYVGMLLLNKPPESWTDEDVQTAHGRATRRCQQLRHVESLHFDRKGGATPAPGTRALRIGMTCADGEDISKVVHVHTTALDALDTVTADVLSHVEDLLGSGGREALLARLAETVLRTDADNLRVSVRANTMSMENDEPSTSEGSGKTA